MAWKRCLGRRACQYIISHSTSWNSHGSGILIAFHPNMAGQSSILKRAILNCLFVIPRVFAAPPKHVTLRDVASNTAALSNSTATGTSTLATAAPTSTQLLSQDCLNLASKDGHHIPSQTIWQTCDTDSWLTEFIKVRYPDYFMDSASLSSPGSFVSTFSDLVGNLMSCEYHGDCVGVPSWPPVQQTVDGIQSTIVRRSIYYMNVWYNTAYNQLTEETFIKDMLSDTIVNTLIPDSQSGGSIKLSSILSMLSAVLGMIPNPYLKTIGGVGKIASSKNHQQTHGLTR